VIRELDGELWLSIGVISKILEHNSIKVALDSYLTKIDELMLRIAWELKEKLSTKKQQEIKTDNYSMSYAQEELISIAKKTSKN
jgi:hypothetical protein